MDNALPGFDYSWRALMESMPVAACMYDPEGHIFWYNSAAVRLWGRHPDPRRDRWCGFVRHYWPDGELMQPDESPSALILQGKAMESGFEAMGERPDGSKVYFIPQLLALHDRQGSVVGGVSMLLDITPRREMEAALRSRETEFRAIIENSPDDIARYDRNCRRIYVNPSLAASVGKAQQELLGRTILDDWDTPSARRFQQHLLRVRDKGEGVGFELSWPAAASGEVLHRYVRIVPEFDAEGQVQSMLAVGRDIGVIKQTEQYLRHSRALLRDLAERREALLEAERKRIAREIHDELGQLLNTLHFSNAALRARLEQDNPALVEKSDAMAGLIRRAVDELRNVATSLRPAALDAGIVCALEWLTQDFSQHTGIVCRFASEQDEVDLPEFLAVALFRIVQESLTNVARHAGASKATVQLSARPDQLMVEVRDNGKGFVVTVPGRRNSLGLVGMQERALALAGRLDITSEPGLGTCVRATIPLLQTRTNVNDQNSAGG